MSVQVPNQVPKHSECVKMSQTHGHEWNGNDKVKNDILCNNDKLLSMQRGD